MSRPRSQTDVKLWAATVFPHSLKRGESLIVSPYWKQGWPRPAPAGRRAWSPIAITSQDDLAGYVTAWGHVLNLGVALAYFRPLGGRVTRAAAAFSRAGCLAVDLDCGPGKPYGELDDAGRETELLFQRSGIRASALVATGTGLQAYFTLVEPCEDPAAFESMLRRLMAALKGDQGAGGRTRIMRPPESLNFKYEPPVEVRLIAADGQRTPWSDLDAALPADPTPHPAKRRKTAQSGRPALRPGKIITSLPRSVDELLKGAMPERYRGDTSRRDFYVACVLAEAGAAVQDIVSTMAASQLGRQAERKPDSDYYLLRTAERAVDKVSSSPYPQHRRGDLR